MRMAATTTMQNKKSSNFIKIIAITSATAQFLVYFFRLYVCTHVYAHMQISIHSVFVTYVSLDGDGCSLAPLGLFLHLPSVQQLLELEKGNKMRSRRKRHTADSSTDSPLDLLSLFVSPPVPLKHHSSPAHPEEGLPAGREQAERSGR